MARIRTIKPEILEDEKTGALSDTAYRLFTSMIFLADDHGNVRADSRWLTGQIWWARREPPRVAEFLREIQRAGLVELYEARGGIYAHLAGWEKHQRIDNAGKPRVPLLNDVDSIPYSPPEGGETEDSRKSSAKFREIPLDPDHRPPTTEMELAAKAPLLKLKAKVDRADKTPNKNPFPSDWEPNDAHRSKASDRSLDLKHEAEQFSNHGIAKGLRYANWDAAFHNWLSNAAKWRDERGGTKVNKPVRVAVTDGDDEPRLDHLLCLGGSS